MEMHMPPPPPPERGKFDESTKTIKCQYCGYSYDNRADIMFCPNCGNSLE
jgi:rubrerythrin